MAATHDTEGTTVPDRPTALTASDLDRINAMLAEYDELFAEAMALAEQLKAIDKRRDEIGGRMFEIEKVLDDLVSPKSHALDQYGGKEWTERNRVRSWAMLTTSREMGRP